MMDNQRSYVLEVNGKKLLATFMIDEFMGVYQLANVHQKILEEKIINGVPEIVETTFIVYERIINR